MDRNNSSHHGGIWIVMAIVTAAAIAGLLATQSSKHPAPDVAVNANVTGLDSASSPSTGTPPTRAESPVQFSLPSDLSDGALLKWARASILNSPQQILAWAESQRDEALRERLLSALLRAWGEQDARAAVEWAFRQDETVRFNRMEAALRGAATDPALALEIGRELLARDSEHGNSYGAALMVALSSTGHFDTALQFAKENVAFAEADWFKTIFQNWAASDPAAAVKALEFIESSSTRDAAFQALITGWADHDYSGLANFAATLSAGANRSLALDAAMSQWCLQQPATLGEWLNNQPASPELDKTIAMLITRTDTENRSPVVAMSWVEGIHDATLQSESLLHVMREWTAQDAAAAWKYFNEIQWLNDAERAAVRQEIETPRNKPEPE